MCVAVNAFHPHNNLNLWNTIPPEIQQTANKAGFTIPPLEQLKHRKLKRGKRGGLAAKLKANPLQTSHSQRLSYELPVAKQQDGRTTTAAHLSMSGILYTDCHRVLAGSKHPRRGYRASGPCCLQSRPNNRLKTKGGGLCVYIHNRWCTNVTVRITHCSRDIEYMMLQCRPV